MQVDKQEVLQIIREYEASKQDKVPGINSPLLKGEVSILNWKKSIGDVSSLQAQIDSLDTRVTALEP